MTAFRSRTAGAFHLDERFGDKISDQEKSEIARHYARLKLAPLELEARRESLRRIRQCEGGDIVHGWDDQNDFSMWKDTFKLLKPPPPGE